MLSFQSPERIHALPDRFAIPVKRDPLLAVHPLTLESHETGLPLARKYRLSADDAMIAASALHAGCHRLWTEDMQHGITLEDRLHIVDSFHGES